MSRVYAIGDLHFGHKNITNFREQFDTPEQHDKFIMDNIMKTCGKRDTLYLFGDCFFTTDSLKYLCEMKESIGQVHLILGNHDSDSKHRQFNLYLMQKYNLIDNVHALVKYKDMWLSHAPIHDSELRGKYNVHGHTHFQKVDDTRYACVSCEHINYTPIDFQKIKEKLSGK